MSQQLSTTPAALYARVSSDRQDVDLSVAAQLRALRDFAERNGYRVAREYIDEAESGRVANRPQFRKMLDEGAQADAPFQEILVWKFSRFTRKREHAVAFKSMLRRRGIRVTSITEHADDTPTGKLMEAIIESVDEFYSENLAQEVTRGMREAASRGFFLASKAPYGYKRIKVQDGPKERPTLEIDPATAPIVKEIFEMSQRGLGLKEIARELNGRGLTIHGRRWYKRRLHYLLTNEAYTGTSVWGRTAKDGQRPDPVRVENAWPAIVSRELFEAVGRGLKARSPKVRPPRQVGSKFLLSGLLKCSRCGKSFVGQRAKSGQFAYYVCNTLHREGSGACAAPYISAPKLEDLVTHKVLTRILNEQTIIELVQMVAEEIDAMAAELNTQLQSVENELADVRRRLAKLYDALENSDLTYADLSPRIHSLRGQEDQLAAAHEDAARQLEQRRAELPSSKEIKRYVADFREFLQAGSIPERKALMRNFVKRIKIAPDQVELTYTIPMPSDGATIESESVLGIVQSSPPHRSRGSPAISSRYQNPAAIQRRFVSLYPIACAYRPALRRFRNSERHEGIPMVATSADFSDLPGRLIVVEGIDGSGKSTQLDLLHKWLRSEGYVTVFTEWNSSPIVRDTTKRGKRKQLLTPMSFSLIHAADFASRTHEQILPALQAGVIVLADRYVYTAFARDAARGVNRKWVRDLYSFAPPPDLALYFHVTLEESMRRIDAARAEIKFYEAGMDLGLSDDVHESFRLFQGRILEEYEALCEEYDITRVDASQSLVSQQTLVRELVEPLLEGMPRREISNVPPHLHTGYVALAAGGGL